jgi:hypothetical protein
MRSFLWGALMVYALLVASCLIYLAVRGGDILSAIPAVIVTEPWSSLFGFLWLRLWGDSGWNTAGMDDYISGPQVALLIASGLANAAILWGTMKLFAIASTQRSDRG